MPGLVGRPQLQYTEAVLYEVMRTGSVVPASVPHKTVCDSTVCGYDVPQVWHFMVWDFIEKRRKDQGGGKRNGVNKRERERERERETDRQTDRQTETQRETETER